MAKAKTASGGNAALEKAIEADPDNLDNWSVYADWLQAQNDPRGELAAVHIGLATSPKDKTLLSSEKKLFKDHADTLIGGYAKYLCKAGKKDIPSITAKVPLEPDYRESNYEGAPFHIEWRAGFIKTITVGHPGMDWSPPSSKSDDEDDEGDTGYSSYSVPKLVTEVLASPAARFMTGLRLGMPNDMEDGECDYPPVIKELAKQDLSRLRSLYIGDITQEESEVSWINIGDLSKLWSQLKNLKHLTLRGGGGLKLGAINLPELRDLTIITGGLDKKNVAAICAAKWPKLHKLELWFGRSSYGGNVTLKDLKPILDGKAFPKLTSLGLRNCEFADELAVALSTAKITPQLKKLDLSKGTLTDTGVDAMIKAKDAFSHLQHLDLSDNYLAKSARTATQIIPAVRTKPQRTPSEWDGEQHRYAALGE
ncbi:MAG: TIGR02996 domain-containing protein [Kofleriaceae bacterium]